MKIKPTGGKEWEKNNYLENGWGKGYWKNIYITGTYLAISSFIVHLLLRSLTAPGNKVQKNWLSPCGLYFEIYLVGYFESSCFQSAQELSESFLFSPVVMCLSVSSPNYCPRSLTKAAGLWNFWFYLHSPIPVVHLQTS